MALFLYDFEASGLLDEPDLYYHCGLFKQHHKNNFMLFLPLNDRTHYTEEDVETAKQFALNKQTIYKNCQVRVADFKYLEEWLTGHSDWSPTALACHNCFDYDQILMEKLSGIHFDLFEDKDCMGTINGHRVNLFDTLPMSRILWPDRPLPKGCPESVFNPVTKKSQAVGPHGLMAWGYALGNQKVKIDDWRNLPLWKYVDRVWEDVIIQELLWDELIAESKGTFYGKSDMQNFMYDPDKEKPQGFKQITWKYALRRGMLQHFLMGLQARQGVYFDTNAAIALRQKCDDMMKEIADRVEPLLPLKEVSEAQKPKFPQKPFNTDGSISSHGYSWLKNKLGYPVNEAAFDFKPAPKRAFNKDGSVSATGIKWCEERGCTDPEKQADFLRAARSEEAPKPLPDDLMQQAIKDLQDKKMPDCMVPMRMSNQMDIKRYLISVGWQPTMWRTKDLTRDYHKKQLPDAEIDAKVREYMDELETSEYRTLVIRELNRDARFKISEAKFLSRKNSPRVEQEVFAKFRRKARGLPTSPQLKDSFGHLCPNLAKLQGEMAKDIVFWLSLRNRRSVLDPIKEDKVDTGLLNHPRLQIDHRLPAESSGLTATGRQKHKICANQPKPSPKVVLGKEMRSLWKPAPGKYQLGVDGSNLEQLIGAWGAWEFDNGLYYRVVSEGDAHCYSGDTQILTEQGWVRFEDLKPGTKVFQYNHDTSSMSLVTPLDYIKRDYSGDMYHFHNSGVDFMVTDQHRMLTVDYRRSKLFEDLAKDLKVGKGEGTNSARRFIHTAEFYGATTLSSSQINLLLAIHDDGNLHANKNGTVTCRIEVAKERKIAKLLETFLVLGLNYTEQAGKTTKGGSLTKRFQFHVPTWVFRFLDDNKDFTYELMDLDKESKNMLIATLSDWDGWRTTQTKTTIFYSQADCRKKSVEVVSALATQCGLRNNTVTIHKEGHAVQHRVTIGSKEKAGLLTLHKDLIEVNNSLVYCVTVPSGAIVVRRNGKVAVCGNCNNAKAYSKVIGREVSRGDGKPITYACLPKDTTTVLTRDGWKEFKDLVVGMDVLTYNTKEGVSEWKPIQHVVEFDNQPVIKMGNSHFEFESTADHRWFGDRRTGKKNRYYVQEFFTTEEFKGERRILRSAVAEGGGLCVSPEEAGVLGWLVADGYFHWSGFKRNKEEGITARIVQCEKKYTEEIRQTLVGANISWSEHYSSDDRVDFLLCSKDIRKLFDKLPFGRVNKDEFPWTKLVLTLSQPARAAWLGAFYLAEGWADRSGNKIICQNEGEYLEAVRLAIYLEGMVPVQHNHGRSSRTGYAGKGICQNLRLSDRKFLTCQRLTKTVSRNTDVFCLTTENSTFVARQGNHITITGNCLYGAQKDKIADMLDIPPDLGQSIIDALWDANPGLKGRKEALEKFWEATGKKFIYAFDGHAIWTRSKHSLLNAYQQNGGASLCDLVGLLVHRNLMTLKIDGKTWYDWGVRRVIYYHKQHCGFIE